MYTQNNFMNGTQVLCSFFSKPLTLVLAIVLSASTLIQFLCGIISGSGISMDVFSVCLAIGFFMLYFRAKSQNPFTNFNAPLTLIKVISIISASLNGLALIMMVFITFFVALLSAEVPEIAGFLILVFLLVSIMLFIYLFYSIGFAIFASSMKKTSVSLELKRTGSVLTGVSGLVYFFIMIVGIVICLVSIDLIMASMTDMFGDVFAEVSLTADSYVYSGSSGILGITDLIPSIISFVFACVNLVITSVYALYYNSYIKKVEKRYKPQRPDYVTPYQNLYGNPQICSVDYKKASAPDPMYAAVTNNIPDGRVSCPSCGSIVENSIKFCPHCGYKLIKEQEN